MYDDLLSLIPVEPSIATKQKLKEPTSGGIADTDEIEEGTLAPRFSKVKHWRGLLHVSWTWTLGLG